LAADRPWRWRRTSSIHFLDTVMRTPHPVFRMSMLVRDGNDVDVVGLDRVQHLVRKPAQRRAADPATLDRASQRPVADALQRATHLRMEGLPQPRRLLRVIASCSLELQTRLWRDQQAHGRGTHYSGPNTSSAAIPSAFPARCAANLRSASSSQTASIVGSGRSRLCRISSASSRRVAGSSASACLIISRGSIPALLSLLYAGVLPGLYVQPVRTYENASISARTAR